MVNGRTTRRTVSVSSLGLTEAGTKAISKATFGMGTGKCIGMMELAMMDNGEMGYKMVQDSW